MSTINKKTTLGSSARSNLWFYPGEELKQGEMRITLMGTGWGNVVTPVQKGPSIFVELGISDTEQDSFVFDVGPGCILNYNAMNIPMSKMDKIFLSHLHMDHCSDLPFIYAFGPNLGDRYKPLFIHGPSGPNLINPDGSKSELTLGTKNLVNGMQRFTQWHTTSFKTMTYGAESSYNLEDRVKELDYRVCGGTAHESGEKGKENNHVIITHFPAVHIIDGAISYRLEWSPAGQDEYMVFVYSGDTLPSDFMIEYGKGADLLIHETAPSIDSVMNGADSTEDEALAIVCNSHTPAYSLGSIIAKTNPQLAVTTHSPMDPRSIEDLITGVRKGIDTNENLVTAVAEAEGVKEQQKYQVGADLMVFNVFRKKGSTKSTITTRMSSLLERPWPVREEDTPLEKPPIGKLETMRYRKSVSIDPPTDKLKGIIFEKVNYEDQCLTYFDNLDND